MSLLSNISNFVNKQKGTPFDEPQNFGGLQDMPWLPNDVNEAFFKPLDINTRKWDKLYPYRLLVIDVTNGNKIVGKGRSSGKVFSEKKHLQKIQMLVLNMYIVNKLWTVLGILHFQ